MVGTWQTSDCRNPDNACLGDLQAGTYSSQFFEPRPLGEWAPRYGALTYTVPDGWAASSDFPESYALLTQEAYAAMDLEADGCSACPDGIAVWAAPIGRSRRLRRRAGARCRHVGGGAGGVGRGQPELRGGPPAVHDR